MSIALAYLEKGLSNNKGLSDLVLANHNLTYLTMIDNLLKDLYNSKCSGIDTKIKEVNDLLRFEGLVSELQFARYFCAIKQWQVDLLPNNVFGERKAPDMLVNSNASKYFVEVKNIQLDSDEHKFGLKVAELLNAKGRHFKIFIQSSSLLATPAYKYQTKKKKEELIEIAEQELNSQINKISDAEQIISTSAAKIRLYPSENGKSFLGATLTGVITEPADYRERIVRDVIQKSEKREDWKDGELDIPYLIAIDDSSWLLGDAVTYNIELYGNSTEFYPPLPVPASTINADIERALELGWKDYLLKMHILRNGRSLIEDKSRGKLFTEPKLKNATAVLVRHNLDFYLLANPLADNRINRPNILEELADCSIGW